MSTVKHEPTEETKAAVSALCTYGVPQLEICKYLGGMDAKTLRKHYRQELDSAVQNANLRVGEFLYNNATGSTIKDGASHSDCVRAAMFWAKTRMGFKEKQEIDHTSSDGSMTPKGKTLDDFYGEAK